MKFIYLAYIFLSLLFPQHGDIENQDWTILQNEDIWIGVLNTNYPKCKTEGIVDASFAEITASSTSLSIVIKLILSTSITGDT